MALKVIHDGTGTGDVAERCCVCRTKTRFWWGKGERNVALCEACAKKVKSKDLPTKAEWIQKERSNGKKWA